MCRLLRKRLHKESTILNVTFYITKHLWDGTFSLIYTHIHTCTNLLTCLLRLLTVEQYLGIDENARKNLYLQKHLGPYLHSLNRKNYKKKNELLPQWDAESVASMNSSKRIKKGYLYRAKSLVKYYSKMPIIPENYNDPNKANSVIIDVVNETVTKDDNSVQSSEDNV